MPVQPPRRVTIDLVTDVQISEAEFIEVVNKRKKNKKNTTEPLSDVENQSGTESRSRSNSRTARKEKLHKLKEQFPPKTFTVTIGEGDKAELCVISNGCGSQNRNLTVVRFFGDLAETRFSVIHNYLPFRGQSLLPVTAILQSSNG
jgi:hypothetical protein|uniref:Uncharacterized protein n=1 Tax=Sipha flava TaxID=143950 RepID=A0A2S2Q9N6_9HEMI